MAEVQDWAAWADALDAAWDSIKDASDTLREIAHPPDEVRQAILECREDLSGALDLLTDALHTVNDLWQQAMDAESR